jgi:hypothetical protein
MLSTRSETTVIGRAGRRAEERTDDDMELRAGSKLWAEASHTSQNGLTRGGVTDQGWRVAVIGILALQLTPPYIVSYSMSDGSRLPISRTDSFPC